MFYSDSFDFDYKGMQLISIESIEFEFGIKQKTSQLFCFVSKSEMKWWIRTKKCVLTIYSWQIIFRFCFKWRENLIMWKSLHICSRSDLLEMKIIDKLKCKKCKLDVIWMKSTFFFDWMDICWMSKSLYNHKEYKKILELCQFNKCFFIVFNSVWDWH